MLWFGGEDTSVVSASGIGWATGNAPTTYARIFAQIDAGSSTADPIGARLESPTFTACAADCWVHGSMYIGTASGTAGTNNQQALFLRSPDGVGRVYLRQNGTSGTLKLSTANAARTFTDKATATATFGTGATEVDWHVQFSCSSGDVTNLYFNQVLVLTFTGNLCTDAATSLNQAGYSSFVNYSSGACNNSGNTGSCWSELIVANEDTRGMHVATCALQAAGNTQGWTPNTLGNVNKSTISDGSFVSTSANNTLSQWTCPTAAPAGIWAVKSVSIEGRLLHPATGPQNFDWSTRVSGSDYLAGTTTALTTSFANYRQQYDTSPATSTTWGISEVFNTSTNQLNIGVKSLP